MFEVLTGMGLATSAGLNAYIPLLAIGLLTRYTDLIDPPSGWQWLSNGWMLAILAALLLVEMVADKVPTVDHVNDVLQTVVRPTSGGLVFGASSTSQTVTVDDPSAFFDSHQWVPIVAGVLIALGVHTAKASARPVINAATFGLGAPIASAAEDAASALLSVIAIVLPILVIVGLGGLAWSFWRVVRRARRRRSVERAVLQEEQTTITYRVDPPPR
ncbi:MAG: DUF4126 domain-containing protein [Micromonosporaceae bacterium]|nr:DUF4126 domain-containing protein [Micromonosporaceae bacterium]